MPEFPYIFVLAIHFLLSALMQQNDTQKEVQLPPPMEYEVTAEMLHFLKKIEK